MIGRLRDLSSWLLLTAAILLCSAAHAGVIPQQFVACESCDTPFYLDLGFRDFVIYPLGAKEASPYTGRYHELYKDQQGRRIYIGLYGPKDRRSFVFFRAWKDDKSNDTDRRTNKRFELSSDLVVFDDDPRQVLTELI